MRVAALVKQIPQFEAMELGPDGRLQRAGVPLEMSAYCRRAVAKGVELARDTGGSCTVVTLGPPSAEDVLREALAFGADDAVHVSDPAFAGSDTLATARALAAALRLEEPFDLILVGRNSVDADTGQVGPQLAQLLDLPFATGVKRLVLLPDSSHGADGDHGRGGATGAIGAVEVGLELDDEWVEATVPLPAVLSTAERLIDPCKIKDPDRWAAVDPARIRRLTAADLGPGPWGQEGSATWVGRTRTEVVERDALVVTGPTTEQVTRLVEYLKDRGVLSDRSVGAEPNEAVPTTEGDRVGVVVMAEPDRERFVRELLAGAARLAHQLGTRVAVIGSHLPDDETLAGWGADDVIRLEPEGAGELVEEDVAAVAARWLGQERPEGHPEIVLTGSTAWGREVASRVAASLGAGLTGDAVGLSIDEGRLLAWKPAFGGTLVAAIHATSPLQMATVRAGVLPLRRPRPASTPRTETVPVRPRGRVTIRLRRREDDIDALANAETVIGVGLGVEPTRYGELSGLRRLLGAEMAATRKVTDNGWMPHARQIGITGHSIAPRLYFAFGTSGKYNHTVGVRSAGTVVAVNPDPDAPIFKQADIGLVGDWTEIVPELERRLRDVIG
jgi:electron transfer flavoprotein alpha subunit